MPSATSPVQLLSADAALERARAHLLARQHADGWWKGALDTNVTMDAEDLLLREFLGVRGERETRMATAWIRSQQRGDGSWGLFHGADGDLSTTVEAYAALRLAGDPPEAAHMRSACAFVRAAGGLEQSRAFTRIWLALFGLWSWEDLPALAPEIMLLPDRAPLSIYRFGCWARQTVVALSIVMAERPVRPVSFSLDELHIGERPRRRNPAATSWTFGATRWMFAALDRAARLYGRRPVRALREPALARARCRSSSRRSSATAPASTCASRSSTTPTSSPTSSGAARSSSRRSTMCPRARPSSSPPTASPRPCARPRPSAGSRSSTRHARW
jgi:squalene-hopene/tetraprenyl-beta-curcumene cyclase